MSCSEALGKKQKTYTPKPQYNDPFNNKFPAIKNLVPGTSVVNFIVKSPSNNEISAIKNKIFGPFRFVILRFPCNKTTKLESQQDTQFCPGKA
jgi:hypothetical protein